MCAHIHIYTKIHTKIRIYVRVCVYMRMLYTMMNAHARACVCIARYVHVCMCDSMKNSMMLRRMKRRKTEYACVFMCVRAGVCVRLRGDTYTCIAHKHTQGYTHIHTMSSELVDGQSCESCVCVRVCVCVCVVVTSHASSTYDTHTHIPTILCKTHTRTHTHT